ncbi:MAG: hypothetical protein IPG50_19485 [Myxococcales bacterium]|nr:hypothetical protein [Myxococcales bacterium]
MPKTNLAWMLVAAWIGCTSTTDPVPAGSSLTDAGKDAKASAAATTDSGSSATDAGATKKDSGSVAPVPCSAISGGLPCDPGKLSCGSSTCDTATQECCVDLTGASAKPACVNKGSCANVALQCDEADDCGSGEVCCFSASGVTPTGSLCQSGPCGLGDFSQSCRGDGECAGSGSCGSGSCKGFAIQTCSPLPASACQ